MKVGANHHREVRRISVLGAAILAGVTLIASLVAYTIMQRQTEFILDATLALSTQSRVNLFETGIENSLENAITIATRPHIIQLIKKLNAAPDSSEIRLNLKQAALSFIPTGLSALAISGADGKELIRGRLCRQSRIGGARRVALSNDPTLERWLCAEYPHECPGPWKTHW